MTKLDWAAIQAAMPTYRPVRGGYTPAQRGLVQLADGQIVFVKLAVDEKTQGRIAQERHAYHWLAEQGYTHAPELLAESNDGLALPDLSAWDWADKWDDDKIAAVLLALDSLAALSPNGMGVFGETTYDADYWPSVPKSVQTYDAVELSVDDREQLAGLLSDPATRQTYTGLAADDPWRGDQLVHTDARADNFAYDPHKKQGILVDWNWLGYGSSAFDQTSLMINVQLSGFAVLPKYAERLDRNSLAWFVGFWLASATGEQGTENLRRLRPRQIRSALAAHDLLRQL